MRHRHTHWKRVGVVLAVALALVAAPVADAATATTIAAAGTAIDVSALDALGNDGPCAVALAASTEGNVVTGSGSLVAAAGTALRAGTSTCLGGAATIRFAIRRVTTADAARMTLHIRVTAADDPALLARTGSVTVDTLRQSIRVEIGRHRGIFDPEGGKGSSGAIDVRTDVDIAAVAADEITHYAATGTAVDVEADRTQVYGDCALAVAGLLVSPADPARADGLFTGMMGQGQSGRDTRTCLGGVSDFTFALDQVATDGESVVTAEMHVAESDAGPAPGIAGALSVDEENQLLSVRVRRQTASFGPGRHLVADAIETRAAASVETRSLN